MGSLWQHLPLPPKVVLALFGVLPHRVARADRETQPGGQTPHVVSSRPAPTPFVGSPASIYAENAWSASPPAPVTVHHTCKVPWGFASSRGQVFDERGFWLEQASQKWRPGPKGTTRLRTRPFAPLPRQRGSVAVLTSSTQHYYFHWLFDVLPRVHCLGQEGHAFEAVLVDQAHSFQRESLSTLGLTGNRLLAEDHPLIRAKELVVPCHQIADGHTIPRWVVSFLRERLIPSSVEHQNSGLPTRIYATRQGATHRRVSNEDALGMVLQRHDIQKVALENLSVPEQIALFAGAELVVAPHGGALANLVFSSPGCAVIEFQPAAIQDLYYRVSSALSLRYTFVRGSGGDPGRLSLDDYAIDPSELERAIAFLFPGDAKLGSSSSTWSARA